MPSPEPQVGAETVIAVITVVTALVVLAGDWRRVEAAFWVICRMKASAVGSAQRWSSCMPLSRDVLFRIRDRRRYGFQNFAAIGGRTARIGICSPVERLEGHQVTCHTPQERTPSTPCVGRCGGCCGVPAIYEAISRMAAASVYPATVLRLRLPLETGASGSTVSVHGEDCR